MFQVAFVTGIAIQSGFDGFQVLFGALVGGLCCFGCGGWARGLDHYVPGFAMLWYTMGAMLGAFTFTIWQRPVLVTLGPLAGGFLAASGLECLAARLCALDGGAHGPSLLPHPAAPWSGVAGELLALGPGVAAHAACSAVAALVYKSGEGDTRRLHA